MHKTKENPTIKTSTPNSSPFITTENENTNTNLTTHININKLNNTPTQSSHKYKYEKRPHITKSNRDHPYPNTYKHKNNTIKAQRKVTIKKQITKPLTNIKHKCTHIITNLCKR